MNKNHFVRRVGGGVYEILVTFAIFILAIIPYYIIFQIKTFFTESPLFCWSERMGAVLTYTPLGWGAGCEEILRFEHAQQRALFVENTILYLLLVLLIVAGRFIFLYYKNRRCALNEECESVPDTGQAEGLNVTERASAVGFKRMLRRLWILCLILLCVFPILTTIVMVNAGDLSESGLFPRTLAIASDHTEILDELESVWSGPPGWHVRRGGHINITNRYIFISLLLSGFSVICLYGIFLSVFVWINRRRCVGGIGKYLKQICKETVLFLSIIGVSTYICYLWVIWASGTVHLFLYALPRDWYHELHPYNKLVTEELCSFSLYGEINLYNPYRCFIYLYKAWIIIAGILILWRIVRLYMPGVNKGIPISDTGEKCS